MNFINLLDFEACVCISTWNYSI